MEKRSVAPPVQKIFRPQLPPIQQHHLRNGMVVHELRAGTQPLIKLEIVFKAGRPFEHKQQVARFTNHLMREGTQNRSAAEIAEHFDYYGSSILVSESPDFNGFVTFCLKKHFRKLLPVFIEILLAPSFLPKELDRFRKNAKERLLHDLSKNDFVAYREISNLLYGPDNAYGYNSSEEALNAIMQEDVIRHYKSCYTANNATVFICGKTDDDLMAFLLDQLERLSSGQNVLPHNIVPVISPPGRYEVYTRNKHQIAVRMARPLFTRTHPDFNKMYVANTLLGGFFGSRLMTNLREEQGFTYNIYSSMETMLYDGSLLISLETDPDYALQSLEQIHSEMKRLCSEPVSQDELEMVQNYLLGYLLTALDGPFNAMELYKGFIQEGLLPQDFNDLTATIIQSTPEEIMDTAQRYFPSEGFIELLVKNR
jgi:zinc protease